MRVTFKVNLGSIDADKCGVDFKKCTVGESVDCDVAAGKWLVANGIATEVVIPKPPEPEPVAIPVVEETKVEPVIEEKPPEPVEQPAEAPPEPQPEPVVETKPPKNKK